ncbi:MAG: Glycerol kinase [Syntrophaceae bacterium PtaB.Bin095]|nr:MAG: Glycerol kinase [Syntrophaceae bacterium PtaB.Bin095]
MNSVIVIDVGTSSLRSSVVGIDGTVRYSSSRSYSPLFLGGDTVEQDPLTWKAALFETLAEAAGYARSAEAGVLALAIASQRASVIPVGKDGQPLCRAIMWQDKRSVGESAALVSSFKVEGIYRRTGLRADPYFSAPKMLWLRKNRPEIFSRSAKLIGVQDWVVWLLTGQYVTDATQACRTMLMDISSLRWDADLLAAVGLTEDLLPRITTPGSVGGALEAKAAAACGLPPGIPVIISGGDQQSAALALNVLSPGSAAANTGTGSFLVAYADRPAFDPRMRTLCSCGAVPGTWIVEAGVLVSGAAYSWAKEQFFCDSSVEEMNAEVEASPLGARGVLTLPHFKGAAAPYWNPRSRGVFFGVSLETTRGDIARSILEGVAIEMGEGLEVIDSLIAGIRKIGVAGGLTRFDLFNQIQADCFARPVDCFENSEATTLGALMSAGVSLGVYPDHHAAFRSVCPPVRRRLEPDPRSVKLYRDLRERIRLLYKALSGGSRDEEKSS